MIGGGGGGGIGGGLPPLQIGSRLFYLGFIPPLPMSTPITMPPHPPLPLAPHRIIRRTHNITKQWWRSSSCPTPEGRHRCPSSIDPTSYLCPGLMNEVTPLHQVSPANSPLTAHHGHHLDAFHHVFHPDTHKISTEPPSFHLMSENIDIRSSIGMYPYLRFYSLYNDVICIRQL